jgi:hypothetical protein
MDFSKICVKCNKNLPLDMFPIQRKGKLYESMANYCKDCRKKQQYLNLNSSIDKFLSDKFNRTRLRAKKLNVEFDFTKENFIELYKKQNGKCFYTGIELDCKVGSGKSRNSLSVDRIKHELGYTKNNIVLCINRVNTMKNDATLEEIKEWMPGWYLKIINKFKDYAI